MFLTTAAIAAALGAGFGSLMVLAPEGGIWKSTRLSVPRLPFLGGDQSFPPREGWPISQDPREFYDLDDSIPDGDRLPGSSEFADSTTTDADARRSSKDDPEPYGNRASDPTLDGRQDRFNRSGSQTAEKRSNPEIQDFQEPEVWPLSDEGRQPSAEGDREPSVTPDSNAETLPVREGWPEEQNPTLESLDEDRSPPVQSNRISSPEAVSPLPSSSVQPADPQPPNSQSVPEEAFEQPPPPPAVPPLPESIVPVSPQSNQQPALPALETSQNLPQTDPSS